MKQKKKTKYIHKAITLRNKNVDKETWFAS